MLKIGFYGKIFFTKGVYMLVSAVSANYFQSKKIAESKAVTKKEKPVDNANDMAFNSTPNKIKKTSIEKLSRYNSINEWKDFCHKQILAGNLDVIA